MDLWINYIYGSMISVDLGFKEDGEYYQQVFLKEP